MPKKGKSAMGLIVKALLNGYIDIAIIQEPYTVKGITSGITRKISIFETFEHDIAVKAAIAIYNSNLSTIQLSQSSNTHQQTVEISN